MNIKKLKILISQKESETLEFKKSTAQLHAAFETVCAFLNGQGGTVLFGVTDNEHIVGQDVADVTRQAIANETSKLEPAAHIDVNYIPIDKTKQVIAICVQRGLHAPYIYDGRAYQRSQSTTSRMSQHRYEQLLVARGQLNHAWEELIAAKYKIDDLDHDEIRRTIQEGIWINRIPTDAITDSIEAALNRMELLDKKKLKNAAVVLFAKKVFPQYGQCLLKMGRFRGTTRTSDFIDNQQVYGNIFKLLSEADHFIRRHLPIASLFSNDSFERIDEPALPVLAVREAMVNAVCHRDYNEPSSAITLAIFDDRLEIWNYGTLPPKLKLDDLKKTHNSFPRNKLTANVLYSRKYFERWGSGTTKMVDLCKEQGIPEPEFEEYSGGLAIIFKFKKSIGTPKLVESTLLSPHAMSQRQKMILKILNPSQEMTVREVAEQLENAPALRTIGDDLAYLKGLGLVKVEGRAKAARWSLAQ